MVDINDFKEEKKCDYKDRTYSVRDNGSVYRHQKEGSRPAPLDNKWTFGKKDEKTGYMMLAGVRVHQIVATAFHGEPEYPTMVVDHIDTNRCNNRPENLRWLTRLENVLNNPYTRSRIAFLCGSIEAFLKDPSVLRQTASEPNTSWMRTVSKEEAARCLKWLDKWNKEDNPTPKPSSDPKKGIGNWIYTEKPNDEFGQSWDSDWVSREPRKSYAQQRVEIEAETIRYEEERLVLKDSLTPGAKQLNSNRVSTMSTNSYRYTSARLSKHPCQRSNVLQEPILPFRSRKGRNSIRWPAPCSHNNHQRNHKLRSH